MGEISPLNMGRSFGGADTVCAVFVPRKAHEVQDSEIAPSIFRDAHALCVVCVFVGTHERNWLELRADSVYTGGFWFRVGEILCA